MLSASYLVGAQPVGPHLRTLKYVNRGLWEGKGNRETEQSHGEVEEFLMLASSQFHSIS